MGETVFVLGGTRSGKSKFAQRLAREAAGKVTFVATAVATDEEMALRIEAHRRERPREWTTVECQTGVGEAIRAAGAREVVLVDCLSLLVSNILLRGWDRPKAPEFDETEREVEAELNSLFEVSRDLTLLIVVSNEVGQGVVPDTALGRRYRDLLGLANQRAAGSADRVYWVLAGIPQKIKG